MQNTFLIVFLVTCSLDARASGNDVEAAMEEFHAADLSDGELFEVVWDPEGRPVSVLGRFDIGLDAGSMFDPDACTAAVTEFALAHPNAFDVAALDFRAREILPVSDTLSVAHFDQYVDGLRAVDSEVTAGLWNDGTLQSLNGAPVHSGIEVARVLGLDEAVAEFSNANLLRSGADELVFDGFLWRSGDVTVEEVFSGATDGAAWQLTTSEGIALLDEATSEVISFDDRLQYLGMRPPEHIFYSA